MPRALALSMSPRWGRTRGSGRRSARGPTARRPSSTVVKATVCRKLQQRQLEQVERDVVPEDRVDLAERHGVARHEPDIPAPDAYIAMKNATAAAPM